MTAVVCEHCSVEQDADLSSFRGTPGIVRLQCNSCGEMTKIRRVKKGRSDNQRRSRDQEKRAAARYGGRVQAGSGSSWRGKGDFVEEGKHRGECKLTRAKSFSLKLNELLKLEKEATGMELPLFEIEFQGVSPKRRYVVLRAEDYASIVNDLEYPE